MPTQKEKIVLLKYSKKGDPRGRHIVLIVPFEDAFTTHSIVRTEVLPAGTRALVEKDKKTGNSHFLFNADKYLDRLLLCFPSAELSPGIVEYLGRQEAKRLAALPMPDYEFKGFKGKFWGDFQAQGAHAIASGSIDLLNDGVGLGKQQPVSEPVLTPDGWRRIGDLRVGDAVIGSNGKSTTVTGVFPQECQETYEVTMNDGSSARCGPEHLWLVRPSSGTKWRTATTRQIIDGEVLETQGDGANSSRTYRWKASVKKANGWLNLSIPVVEPVIFGPNSDDLLIDPYTLGVFLGDGNYTQRRASISTDRWIIDKLSWVGRIGDCRSDKISELYLDLNARADLSTLGLKGLYSHQKFVPQEYLFASVDDRLSLLQGLMDTDGSPIKDGGSEFSTTSLALAEAVCTLTQSLGGVARWNKDGRRTWYGYKGERRQGRTSWRVNIKLPATMCPFTLPRKADKFVAPSKYPPSRVIANIERVADEQSVCISVSADDQLYVTKDFIVTHNTFQTIAAMCKMRSDAMKKGQKRYRTLIVCPNNVKYTWQRVVHEQTDLKCAVIDTGVLNFAQRQMVFDDDSNDVVVVNAEGMRARPIHVGNSSRRPIEGWSFTNPGIFVNERVGVTDWLNTELDDDVRRVWDFAVIDEHHTFKTPDAYLTRGLFQLRQKRFLGLSGTPVLNRPEEIWTMLHKLYPKTFQSYDKFESVLAVRVDGKKIGYNPDAMAELRSFLQDKTLRRRKEQIRNDLPNVIDIVEKVTMQDEQRELYEKVKNELLLVLDDGTQHQIMGVLPQITRLKQAAFSPELYGGSAKSAKIDRLKEIVKELVDSGEKALIFSQWSKATNIIRRELAEYHPAYITGEVTSLKQREAEMHRFNNDPSCQVLIGTIRANREGVNLGAASYVIFTDLDWVPAGKDQAVGRSAAGGLRGVNLSGKDAHVHVIEIQAEDTCEEWIQQLLESKRSISNRMIERDAGKQINKIEVEDIVSMLRKENLRKT